MRKIWPQTGMSREPWAEISSSPLMTRCTRISGYLLSFCLLINDAKGEGPAAIALKTKPADLTLISKQNDNKYPEIRVQRVINGEDEISAHGSRDMPVWGQIFRMMSANQDMGKVRVYNL